MVFAHVIDVKTGLERKNVMVKAYELIKKRYTLLGYVDENGNPVDGPQVQAKAGKTQKKTSVEPVARVKMTDEEKAAKMAELKAMNETAIQKVKDEQAAKEQAKTISVPEHTHIFSEEAGKEIADQVLPIKRQKT